MGAAAGSLLGLVAGCSNSAVFWCTEDAQCQADGGAGQCEADGYCSFPDHACASGRRYGLYAPSALARECVAHPEDSDAPAMGSGPEPDWGTTASTRPGEDHGETAPALPAEETSETLLSVSFTDDQWTDEFGAGSLDRLRWDGDALRLDEGALEGTIVSRPFDAAELATWLSLSWQPQGPYGKPLPDGGAQERGYAEDGIGMADNLLLLHFDGLGDPTSGAIISDASGQGHDAVLEGAASSTQGRVGEALRLPFETRLVIDPEDFAVGEGDVSWAVWVRFEDPCVESPAIIGLDSASDDPSSSSTWLACFEAGSDFGCMQPDGGTATVGISTAQGISGGSIICGDAIIDDGAWHHIVFTKEGSPLADARIYVDGALDEQGEIMLGGALELSADAELSIGAQAGATFPFEGELDELAVWRRALGPGEVAALYRRGALRLGFRVRACDLPDCADAPAFEGPNGPGSDYEDPAEALGPGTMFDLADLPTGQVFQYEAVFSTSRAGESPGLAAVTATGRLEP